MAVLFTLSGDDISVLSATSFEDGHEEVEIQHWADRNPHLLNDGAPMLSLGCEIVTSHNQSIDNIYIDGNSCLVVAEIKRARTPRDVMAQVLEYAAYVSRLGWDDLEPLCRKRHGTDLDSAFQDCFGRPLVRSEKLDHRLLVVAESYDPRTTDAALYLINGGTPLALLEFTYFEVDGRKLFEVKSVLGEIPDQGSETERARTLAAEMDEGHANWIFSSVAKALPEMAERQGWNVKFKINKQSLPFVSDAWPTTFGDCQLRLDTYKQNAVAFTLSARKDATPDFMDFLNRRRENWHDAFPAELANPPYPTVYSNLSYDVPLPKMGDTDALADIIERTDKMAGAMAPLVSEYFETRQGGGS